MFVRRVFIILIGIIVAACGGEPVDEGGFQPVTYNAPLDRYNWTLSASDNETELALAIDDNTRTRWGTRKAQSANDWLEIDFGATVSFNRILLDSNGSPNDHPRRVNIFISDDGTNWGDAIVAAEGTSGTTQIDIPIVETRFLRIDQLDTTDRWWWSIYELNIMLSDNSNPVDLDPVDPPDTTALFELGAKLYAADCASCHGSLEQSTKRNRTKQTLSEAIAVIGPMRNITLDDSELDAIIYALNNDNPNGPLGPVACTSDKAIRSPLRLITETEYDNAVHSLLGVSLHDTRNLIIDSESGPFATNRGTSVSTAAVSKYLESAETVAKLATGELDYRHNWTLKASDNAIELDNAIDGDAVTRWSTDKAQAPNQWLSIDLGAVRRFDQIAMAHPRSRNDFPAQYEVFLSNDGSNWGNPVASGSGTLSNTVINITSAQARHIRIVQLGFTERYFWSIHELNILHEGETLGDRLALDACNSLDCADTFIESFARRAYRGYESNEDINVLKVLLRSGEDITDGIQRVIERVLQSPKFLYQVERSVEGSGPKSRERLTGLSIAEKLASFLWNAFPDEALLQAAERGDLDSNDGIQTQVQRMLRDPQAAESFADFIEQWFATDLVVGVLKDTDAYPQFTRSVSQAMKDETKYFVMWMIDNNQFTFEELLLSSKAFPGGVLASFYGVASQPEGAPIDLDERVGILTHPSVTASHSVLADTSVVGRGNFILETLLCITLPDPPPDVEALLSETDPTLPIRERLAQHNQDPACAVCHDLIDPLGYALESYDAIGAFRMSDNLGFPVETFGSLMGTDQDGDFSDVRGLMNRVFSSETGASCAVEQWMRFAQRRLMQQEDQCSMNHVSKVFKASDYDFNELVKAIVVSDAFLYRDSSDL